MKASTLFAITVSLLLGLGAVAGARAFGLFERKEAPPPAREPALKVLVAATNLFEDVVVTADQVTILEVPPESPDYARLKQERDAGRLLPPRQAAAALRLPKRNINAEEPLYRALFRDLALPDRITDRLDPGMRSVTVMVPKDKVAGGVIRTGEYVDVVLTTDINYQGDRVKDATRTNTIARGCKVIMKRNTIWNAMGSDPDGQPLPFTLQVNPYRAALIEFATNRGVITLQPTSSPAAVSGSHSDLNSKEYADEQARVDATLRNEYTVSTADLVRIFNLVPPTPVAPPPPPKVTRNIAGTEFVASKVFSVDGIPLGVAAPGATAESLAAGRAAQAAQQQGDGFSFGVPSSQDPKNCPTCNKK